MRPEHYRPTYRSPGEAQTAEQADVGRVEVRLRYGVGRPERRYLRAGASARA